MSPAIRPHSYSTFTKMIGMDFATIVEELLPESLASLNQLSGK